MTRLVLLMMVGLLLGPSVSGAAAQTEAIRIRSTFVDPAGEVSAVVEHPPGPTPRSADFGLLLDGRRVEARDAEDQRLNLMFLVDVSGSMKGAPLADVAGALTEFLKAPRAQDQFALTFFANEDTPQATFEDPREKIIAALSAVRTQGAKTKLYQALSNALQQGAKDDPRTRRVIVVLTDGQDVGSTVTLEQVITESKARLVPIYTIFRGAIVHPFADVLTGLAKAANGQPFPTRNRGQIESALDQIYQLETSSVTVRFAYPVDPAGRTAQNAVVELRRPAGTLRATLPETVSALKVEVAAPPIPWWKAQWWIVPLLLALLVLAGLVAFWLWRRGQKRPEKTVPPVIVKRETPPEVVDDSRLARPRRETVVIGQHFPAPASGQPAAVLRGISGPVAGQEIAMETEVLSIGADAGSDLAISGDEYVSGAHAYLRYEQGSLFIFDRASRNGTFVNDNKVTESGTVLRPGDRITLGLSTFTVVMPGQ